MPEILNLVNSSGVTVTIGIPKQNLDNRINWQFFNKQLMIQVLMQQETILWKDIKHQ